MLLFIYGVINAILGIVGLTVGFKSYVHAGDRKGGVTAETAIDCMIAGGTSGIVGVIVMASVLAGCI